MPNNLEVGVEKTKISKVNIVWGRGKGHWGGGGKINQNKIEVFFISLRWGFKKSA